MKEETPYRSYKYYKDNKKHYEHFWANKFDNLDKMDTFF